MTTQLREQRDVTRHYYAQVNGDATLTREGCWVTLLDLERVDLGTTVLTRLLHWASIGINLPLYRGLTYDTRSIGGKIVKARVRDGLLEGFVVASGRLGHNAMLFSKDFGIPIVFLGKFIDIARPNSCIEVIGFRIDFSLGSEKLRKRREHERAIRKVFAVEHRA